MQMPTFMVRTDPAVADDLEPLLVAAFPEAHVTRSDQPLGRSGGQALELPLPTPGDVIGPATVVFTITGGIGPAINYLKSLVNRVKEAREDQDVKRTTTLDYFEMTGENFRVKKLNITTAKESTVIATIERIFAVGDSPSSKD